MGRVSLTADAGPRADRDGVTEMFVTGIRAPEIHDDFVRITFTIEAEDRTEIDAAEVTMTIGGAGRILRTLLAALGGLVLRRMDA